MIFVADSGENTKLLRKPGQAVLADDYLPGPVQKEPTAAGPTGPKKEASACEFKGRHTCMEEMKNKLCGEYFV